MTVAAWLGTRVPEPPPALVNRIDGALGERRNAEIRAAVPLFVEAADDMLRELLHRPSDGRDSALDLLTVDALVTYAFEASSLDPASLIERATDAMRRFSAAAQA